MEILGSRGAKLAEEKPRRGFTALHTAPIWQIDWIHCRGFLRWFCWQAACGSFDWYTLRKLRVSIFSRPGVTAIALRHKELNPICWIAFQMYLLYVISWSFYFKLCLGFSFGQVSHLFRQFFQFVFNLSQTAKPWRCSCDTWHTDWSQGFVWRTNLYMVLSGHVERIFVSSSGNNSTERYELAMSTM